ncbi:hypothetical protein Ndes2526B_g01739 [Nannochloris sp. 'desiccata']
MKVVFCGKMLHYSFKFSHDELEPDPEISVIQCASEDVKEELADADVAIPLLTALTAEIIQNAPKLKVILQFGVGVEGIDIKTATKLGIFVSNIPSAETGNATSCAEMAIFLSMALLRNINGMATSIATKQLGVPLGQMLYGKNVLVIGFGNIAKDLITRLSVFGVAGITALRRSNTWSNSRNTLRVNGQQEHSTNFSKEFEEQENDSKAMELTRHAESLLVDKGTWPQDSSRLASTADIIILTCMQDSTNRGMINTEFIENCKTGVRIVNVARGGLLNYEAVLAGLNSGKIGGCGLDVQFWEPFDPEDPIATHPNVYLTPHTAGVTETSYRTMAKIVAEEVRRVFRGERPTVQLNTEEEMKNEGAVPRLR